MWKTHWEFSVCKRGLFAFRVIQVPNRLTTHVWSLKRTKCESMYENTCVFCCCCCCSECDWQTRSKESRGDRHFAKHSPTNQMRVIMNATMVIVLIRLENVYSQLRWTLSLRFTSRMRQTTAAGDIFHRTKLNVFYSSIVFLSLSKTKERKIIGKEPLWRCR